MSTQPNPIKCLLRYSRCVPVFQVLCNINTLPGFNFIESDFFIRSSEYCNGDSFMSKLLVPDMCIKNTWHKTESFFSSTRI